MYGRMASVSRLTARLNGLRLPFERSCRVLQRPFSSSLQGRGRAFRRISIVGLEGISSWSAEISLRAAGMGFHFAQYGEIASRSLFASRRQVTWTYRTPRGARLPSDTVE